MKQPQPSTPFSTPLSGSARQAEARIRNLFQCEKKRPPLPLLFLAALLILSPQVFEATREYFAKGGPRSCSSAR